MKQHDKTVIAVVGELPSFAVLEKARHLGCRVVSLGLEEGTERETELLDDAQVVLIGKLPHQDLPWLGNWLEHFDQQTIVWIYAESFNAHGRLAGCNWLCSNSDCLGADYQLSLVSESMIRVTELNERQAQFTLSQYAPLEHHDVAMALAAFMSCGYRDYDAVTLALAWLSQIKAGQGDHWPNHASPFPSAGFVKDQTVVQEMPFPALDRDKFTLYPVVDSVSWLELVLQQGITTAQLRIKDPNHPQLKAQIKAAISLGKRFEAQVFINDYWQLAIELGAYGVHLGQEDIETADLSAIQQAGLRLGISTHGYFEIIRALKLKPSYIALGHIFPTVTKDMPSQPQGLGRLGQYVELINGQYPTVAIGGISAERLPLVKAKGVDSIALVTAITRAHDPVVATRQLLEQMTQEAPVHAALC